MITVLVIMATGMLIGYFIRSHPKIVALNDKIVMITVFALLFLMGVLIGRDAQIVNRLPEIGAKALLLALAGTLFSVVLGTIVYHLFFKKHH